MKRPYRPFRTPFARLLASVLVALALLVNGMAIAQAAGTSAQADCCAGMAGQHGDDNPCHDSGNPCPATGSDCDEQCLARCQGNTALPVSAATPPGLFQRDVAQLVTIARAFSSPPPSPGLRPPISA